MSTNDDGAAALSRQLHVLIDEETYQRVRKVAFARQTSIGDLVRQALASSLGLPSSSPPTSTRPTPAPVETGPEGR